MNVVRLSASVLRLSVRDSHTCRFASKSIRGAVRDTLGGVIEGLYPLAYGLEAALLILSRAPLVRWKLVASALPAN
jgi:hypothetical protein